MFLTEKKTPQRDEAAEIITTVGGVQKYGVVKYSTIEVVPLLILIVAFRSSTIIIVS